MIDKINYFYQRPNDEFLNILLQLIDKIYNFSQWTISQIHDFLPRVTDKIRQFFPQVIDKIHILINDGSTAFAIFFHNWMTKFAIFLMTNWWNPRFFVASDDWQNLQFSFNNRLTKLILFLLKYIDVICDLFFCNWLTKCAILFHNQLTKFPMSIFLCIHLMKFTICFMTRFLKSKNCFKSIFWVVILLFAPNYSPILIVWNLQKIND